MPSAASFMNGLSVNESYFNDTDDLIKNAIDEETRSVIANASILPSNRNKAIVERLYDKGIFNLKDSILKVESIMGISKNTIYMHIRNYKKRYNK